MPPPVPRAAYSCKYLQPTTDSYSAWGKPPNKHGGEAVIFFTCSCLPDGNFELLLCIHEESGQFFIWLIKADEQDLLHIGYLEFTTCSSVDFRAGLCLSVRRYKFMNSNERETWCVSLYSHTLTHLGTCLDVMLQHGHTSDWEQGLGNFKRQRPEASSCKHTGHQRWAEKEWTKAEDIVWS